MAEPIAALVRVKGRVRAVSLQRSAKTRHRYPHSGRNWGGAAIVRPRLMIISSSLVLGAAMSAWPSHPG